MSVRFEVLATHGAARRGRLHTAHGTVETPAFMPVGTAATVKAMTPEALLATGSQMILANTYHLMLRPGAQRVARQGGLHRFMAWPGPILTDSGGFQVLSLAERRQIDENGVTFRSHLDGSRHRLTPEGAVAIQHQLDATVTMVLDECTPYPIDAGGALQRAGFDGYAVGGLAVGEGRTRMFEVLDVTLPLLPAERPRYLMGVGKPDDLIGAVGRGVDLFDCVLPTRSGRTAQAWTSEGPLNLKNARHADDPRPLDEGCDCPACRLHSRAYLHHLVKAGEILAAILLTWHNLHHYQALMSDLRRAIETGEALDVRRMP
jgi:queuine tRNA-ribosyltransferase